MMSPNPQPERLPPPEPDARSLATILMVKSFDVAAAQQRADRAVAVKQFSQRLAETMPPLEDTPRRTQEPANVA